MPHAGVPSRRSAVVVAACALTALLPVTASAQQAASPLCPDDPVAAGFDDRDRISEVHLAAVDCIAALEITRGVGSDGDLRYLPEQEVPRDQMASFIARSLEAAGATLPTPDDASDDAGFEDIEGTTHEDRIRQIAAIGVTEGVTASRYAPDRPVTREQMATFLLRATAWFRDVTAESLAGGPVPFDDVASDDVHAATIAGVYHLGIAQGAQRDIDASVYAPDALVTREQMASFLVRTTAAMLADPTTCTNDEVGYTVTYPQDWATNPGDVLTRCSVFREDRFVLNLIEPIRLDAVAISTTEEIGYEEAAESEVREELARRSETVDGRDAIVVEQRQSDGAIIPEGTLLTTWYVDMSEDDGTTRTLIAQTTDRASDYELYQQTLADVMASMTF